MGPRLTATVLAEGVIYDVGTEYNPQLGEKIPAHLWDGPVTAPKAAVRKTTKGE